MRTVRSLCEQVRNGAYFVKRGYINWSTFPFDKHERAIAILVDEESLEPSEKGFAEARLSFEIFTSIPESENPQIDDGILEELIIDARWIVSKLVQARNRQDDPIIYAYKKNTSSIVESHDATLMVQGIVAIIRVTY